MQKGRIRALINKFENNEFSNETYDVKNNRDFKNNTIKFSKLNSIFSSAGTLNENDEENQNVYYKSMLKESGKLPQKLLRAYQKNDEDLKNKANINNYTKSESYMESTRTLVTQSNVNLLKSSTSLGISQKELNYSLSQFKSETSINNTLEGSNFTLGNINNINKINIISNKEKELVDNNNNSTDTIDNNENNDNNKNNNNNNNDNNDNNENDNEKNENVDIILENEISVENKENLTIQRKDVNEDQNKGNLFIQSKDVDEDQNKEKDEYQDEDESFHVFDMNKIMKNIISVDIGVENYDNNNKIMKTKETIESKEIEITKNTFIKEEYTDEVNSNIINISEKRNNEPYEEQNVEEMNKNIIELNEVDIISDKIQTINNKFNEDNTENIVLDDNSNLNKENEENKILDKKNNINIEIPENTVIEKNINIEEDDEIANIKKRNINEVENEILLDPKEKNELTKSKDLSNNENHSNVIENEVPDSSIYFENFNIVEKKENFDEKTKQYYKEKIIDNRFKLTYLLKRGGCGEIRETIDLVTGEKVIINMIIILLKINNNIIKIK